MSEAVDNARALLRLFVQTGGRDLHVRTAGFELFVARTDGSTSPMARVASQVSAITAPHIATLVSAASPGTAIVAGDVVATLRLLDEDVPVQAEHAGTVQSVLAEPGQLLEYETPILTLTAG